jgi:hypothetical protein
MQSNWFNVNLIKLVTLVINTKVLITSVSVLVQAKEAINLFTLVTNALKLQSKVYTLLS